MEEMGTGHESYVYAYESAQWEDVYGMADSFVLTNVCIKGFTNPLPESKEELSTVRFSQMDGEVNDGTLLELSSAGNEPIEYSMDGSVFTKYTVPIELRFALPDQTHTLLARTVNEEGQTGNTVTRTYSKASAQIGTNRVDSARARQIVSFENGSATIELRNDEEDIYVQTISPDSIAVNGEPAERFAWSDPIELEEGEEVTLQISASAPGKKNSEAALHVRRSPLHFVYRSETISFDSKYTVSTLDGDPIPNGDSIGRLIDDELPAPLLLTYTKEEGTSVTETWTIPARWSWPVIGIDYANERINAIFSPGIRYGYTPDLSDGIEFTYDEMLSVKPGVDVYLQRDATDYDFASAIYRFKIPERPSALKLKMDLVTSSTLSVQKVDGGIYAIVKAEEDMKDPDLDTLEWQGSPAFVALEPDTYYRIYAYTRPVFNAFASEAASLEVRTNPMQDLLDTVFHKGAVLMQTSESSAQFGLYEEEIFTHLTDAIEILEDRSSHTTEQAQICIDTLHQDLLQLRLLPSKERLDELKQTS